MGRTRFHALAAAALLSCLATLPAAPAARADVVTNPAGRFAHSTDGRVTGWPTPGPKDPHEWSDIAPQRGKFGFLYIDYKDGALHILIDWVENNHGLLTTDEYVCMLSSGMDKWQISVYGDNTTEFLKNGKPADGIEGKYVFGRSPNLGIDHTMVELAVRIPPDIVVIQPLGIRYLGTPPVPDPLFPKGLNVDFRSGTEVKSAPVP